MVSLRYVGAEPGSDDGVINQKEVHDYILSATPFLTPPREQAAIRGATFPARQEVLNRYATYATDADLANESAKYFRVADLESGIAGLHNGQLYSTQWPTSYRRYVEPQGIKAEQTIGTFILNRFSDTTLATITSSGGGPWSWMPFVSGLMQVETGPDTTVKVRVRDQSNRIVAEGISLKGKRAMVSLGARSTPVYNGSQTFRVQAMITGGSGMGEIPGWYGQVLIIPVPA